MKFHSRDYNCTSRSGQTVDSHLTHELLPVLVACCADVIVGGQFFFTTPGVQEVLDVRHGDGSKSFAPAEKLKGRGLDFCL